MNLESIIEALLFVLGEPVSIKRLSSLTEKSLKEVKEALVPLEASLKERGIRLVFSQEEVGLATAPEASEIVSHALREEFSEALTKAALETLAIVIYKGPLSRSDVDYIRGVHSSFSLRNLLVRGLIERVGHPDDSRVFLYRPSMNMLTFFGVPRLEDMPEYAEVRKKLEEFVMQNETEENKDIPQGAFPPDSS